MRDEFDWQATPEPLTGLGSLLDMFNWEQVRTDVEEECQARIVLTGLPGVGKSSLLNALRGWEVSPVGDDRDPGLMTWEDLGLFALVDLAGEAPAVEGPLLDGILGGYDDGAWLALEGADLVLFLLDGDTLASAEAAEIHLHPAEYPWFCRLRALGHPLLVVLNKADRLAGRLEAAQEEVERRLAAPVLPLSAHDELDIEERLLPRILDACPRLAVPLGRELPVVRRPAAQRLIRQTACLSALTGLEPVPLLDIPIQLAAQMRMLFKVAALHGRLDAGDGSREFLAAVAGGLGVRLAAQQAAKLVPVLGWVVSGVLSGLTTWMLGQTALAYLDGSLEAQAQRLRTTGWRAKRRRIGHRLQAKMPFARWRREPATCSEEATADGRKEMAFGREARRRRWPGWFPRLRMPFGRNGRQVLEEEEEPCSYDAG